MAGFSFPTQRALYEALTSASIAGGRIHDHAPSDVVFPYVEIGESQAIPDDTSAAGGDDDGVSETFTLHVWDRPNRTGGHRGGKQVREILSSIYTVLHGAALTVSGRASALAWVRSDRVMRDPDGITVHGVVDVEIIHRS